MFFPVMSRTVRNIYNPSTYKFQSQYSVVVGKGFTDGFIDCQNVVNVQRTSHAYFFLDGKFFHSQSHTQRSIKHKAIEKSVTVEHGSQ